MNNWRLLLALVAVFQPIASFTHLNNVDGREHCCDRWSASVLREAKSLFHGPGLYTNTDQRDEIREVRRSDRSLRREEPNRFSKESHLLRNLERDARESVLQIRSEFRLERGEYGRSRERLQVAREQYSRAIPSGELNRNVYRSRDISRENERQQHLFGNINDERVARFTGSQQSRRDTSRLQIRSQERRMDSSNKVNSVMHKRDTLERFETSNTFNNRRQIGREVVLQRAPIAQVQVRREDDVRRSSGDRSVAIRNMRSITKPEIGNNFHFERHSIAQRNELRTQQDSRVFRERTNFLQRTILHSRKDERDFRTSVTRMISEARDSERFSRERQNERNANQRELRKDARQESQRENGNIVQRYTRTESEVPRLFNDQRIIRSTRRSAVNINTRFGVLSPGNIARRSETRGKLEGRIIREVRGVRVSRVRHDQRNDIEVPSNNGQNRITQSKFRNYETRSTENRRDELRRTRDERPHKLRELTRYNMRNLKDLDEQRREYTRAIRTTESRFINNRENINEVRRDRTHLNHFENERVNEIKQTERRSVDMNIEGRRDARSDIRQTNGRTLEIRNKQSSRDARGVGSNNRDIGLRLRLSKENRDKRTVDNRAATRHNVARFVPQERIRDIRREVRNDERRTRESRGMIKSMDIRETEIRRTWAFERDNVLPHRARSEAIINRNIELMLNRFGTIRDHSMDREKTFRTRESSTRKNLTEETKGTDETVAKWQYVLYTLQGIYLCGLFVQMLSPTNSKNGKSRNWWLVPTQTHIKAD